MGQSWTAKKRLPLDAVSKVAQQRLGVRELARELGNVAEAGRQRGMGRTSFHEWKHRFQMQGFEGLKDLPPIHKSHPARRPPRFPRADCGPTPAGGVPLGTLITPVAGSSLRADQQSAAQRRDLMEIVEEPYGLRSTILTSQFPVETWYDVIGEPTFADAILDSLVHNAYRIALDGPSLRKAGADSRPELKRVVGFSIQDSLGA